MQETYIKKNFSLYASLVVGLEFDFSNGHEAKSKKKTERESRAAAAAAAASQGFLSLH